MNFCQLKQDLEQGEKRQNVLEELHNYHNLKTYIGGYHIKTVYRQCNKTELKQNEEFTWVMPARWCECKRRIYRTSPTLRLFIELLEKIGVITILGVDFETTKNN